MKISFLVAKAVVRMDKSRTGLPAAPALRTQESTSSIIANGTGRELKPLGELAPAKFRNPPG
jgi:hypothetical protein